MKSNIAVLVLFILTFNIYGQAYENGTIITKRYDTISNVKIEKFNDSKSLVHLTYIDSEGIAQKPDIESIKCYTRGDEKFVRIYYDCEMILVKAVESGKKVNLYERDYNGSKTYYIEKVFDELIKVPSSGSKFSKEISAFLADNTELAAEINNKQINDIKEIVTLYNKE